MDDKIKITIDEATVILVCAVLEKELGRTVTYKESFDKIISAIDSLGGSRIEDDQT